MKKKGERGRGEKESREDRKEDHGAEKPLPMETGAGSGMPVIITTVMI